MRARVGQGMGRLDHEVEGSRPGEARPEDAVRIRNDRNVPAHACSLGVVPPSLDRWAEDAGQTRARRLNTSYSAQADHRRTIRVLTQTACEPRGTNSWGTDSDSPCAINIHSRDTDLHGLCAKGH